MVLGVVLAVAEAFSLSFVAIMVAAGAFAAAGAAALGAPVLVQGVVFAGVTAAALFAVRPVIRKYQRATGQPDAEPMGIAALEGADALVIESVDAHNGLVRVSGEEWTARAFDATQTFEPGERVQIIKIKGATALVWRMP
ncbi:NfeD family protein [Actinocatenispora rupis]|uniref:Membrane protein n=1 Tax=Actinocatenispora rupis TaxID=519421 RepID=A0A8J3J2K0_9ACTN|nr:membrane protein [Actinocatenispora rupis]